MKLYKKLFSRWTGVAMIATMGLFACQPEIDEPTLTTGSADFTTYVALGNSLTSGYADGALYREGQINSYPEMMAMSMQKLGGAASFSTPLVPEGNGSGGATGKIELTGFNEKGRPMLTPTQNDPSVFASVAAGGPYQNLGVPGARSFHLLFDGYGNPSNLSTGLANPFFVRFATSANASVVADAAAQNPTFFTLWIGNNDVLGYATSGGDQGGDQITPKPLFEQAINGIVAGLDGASGGAIANIPNILGAPYFKAVAYNAFEFEPEEEALVTALNAGLRANASAGVRPLVEAGVRAEVRSQVVAGAIETIIRPAVVAGARANVTTEVTAGVRAGVIQQQLAGGATQAQAEAAADAYIASADGQADITTRVDAAMDSELVKAGIEAEIQTQLALPSTQALIESQTDQQMQSEAVQAIIETQLSNQLDALLANLTVSVGANPFIIATERSAEFPLGLRPATPDDLILLTASNYLGAEAAAGRPPLLPERFVLDPSEQAKVDAAVAEYNTVLQAAAGAKYAYVDMNGFFNQVLGGYTYQGVNYDARFILGGAFSLDGIHLTQRGYALAGNEFIKAINAKYNSKLPWIDVNNYKGITFP
ncbi:hypothetical protein V9L05_05570 [Bernardetia sp. Wsw4-3y2]|uniref:hypothetical protein n=1 Tax=Bernardetia sp. Wsw4-3y2 TaxID=3127471 RepID=UPI0030D2C7D4